MESYHGNCAGNCELLNLGSAFKSYDLEQILNLMKYICLKEDRYYLDKYRFSEVNTRYTSYGSAQQASP